MLAVRYTHVRSLKWKHKRTHFRSDLSTPIWVLCCSRLWFGGSHSQQHMCLFYIYPVSSFFLPQMKRISCENGIGCVKYGQAKEMLAVIYVCSAARLSGPLTKDNRTEETTIETSKPQTYFWKLPKIKYYVYPKRIHVWVANFRDMRKIYEGIMVFYGRTHTHAR